MIILNIIGILIAVALYLVVLKLINKLVFKGKVKINLKEILISGCVIFLINLIVVLANIPFAIGIPINPYFDGGENTYYYSLGYIIHVKKPTIYIDETERASTEVEFGIPGLDR